MDRNLPFLPSSGARKPHARGDGPNGKRYAVGYVTVNPTHVGMDRKTRQRRASKLGKPHARGDGPLDQGIMEKLER